MKLTLAFSTTSLATLDLIISDLLEPPALSLPQDPLRKPQELDIDQIIIAPLGESYPRTRLIACHSIGGERMRCSTNYSRC